MCDACLNINEQPADKGLVINAVLQMDPTRTLTLRKKFVADVDKRFGELKKLIVTSIVLNDCFGLKPRVTAPTPFFIQATAKPGQFAFDRSSAKVEAFMAWLQEQEAAGVLQMVQKSRIGGAVEQPWTNIYIDTAYQRGIRRGRQELRNQGVDIPGFGDAQLRDPVMTAFNQPIHADRVGLIYTRTYSDLKGITGVMDTQISRVLAQGIAEGRGPRELARTINERVDAIGITRARTLARTEVIRAHHSANIQEYRNAGIEGVSVKAEWSTAGFNVCPICSALQGKVFTLDEIEEMIPRHPNCVAGDSVVIAPDVIAAMQTMYSGPVIKFTLTNGARLTVTPNHMLMSPHGLIMARLFHDGDDLLCCPSAQGVTVGDPDNNGQPPRIDEVIKAFSETGCCTATSMPVSPKDFHGDGGVCQGDVHIIGADCFLRDGLNTEMCKMLDDLQFEGRSIFDILFADGSFTEVFRSAFLAPDGYVGLSREQLAFLRGCLLHAQKHGFTPVAGSYVEFFEAPGDNTPIHPQPFSNDLDRQWLVDHLQELISVNGMAIGGGDFTQGQTMLDKNSLDGISLFNSGSWGQGGEGFASHVTSVKINNVEVVHVESLPMYDLSTMSTGYIVNGILSSNCRCVAIPIVM
jgi:SPP1 gp7 family putative phage head morphogenesis protein